MFSSGVNEENSLSIPFLVITPDVSIEFFGSSESEPNSGWDGVTKGGRTGIMTCPTLRAQFNLWESGAFSVVEIDGVLAEAAVNEIRASENILSAMYIRVK